MKQNLEWKEVEISLIATSWEEKWATRVINTVLNWQVTVQWILERLKNWRPELNIFWYEINHIRDGVHILFSKDPLANNNLIN